MLFSVIFSIFSDFLMVFRSSDQDWVVFQLFQFFPFFSIFLIF